MTRNFGCWVEFEFEFAAGVCFRRLSLVSCWRTAFQSIFRRKPPAHHSQHYPKYPHTTETHNHSNTLSASSFFSSLTFSWATAAVEKVRPEARCGEHSNHTHTQQPHIYTHEVGERHPRGEKGARRNVEALAASGSGSHCILQKRNTRQKKKKAERSRQAGAGVSLCLPATAVQQPAPAEASFAVFWGVSCAKAAAEAADVKFALLSSCCFHFSFFQVCPSRALLRWFEKRQRFQVQFQRQTHSPPPILHSRR